VQSHELLNPFLAHPDSARQQFLPRARPAEAAVRFSVDDLDVHQQRVVAEEAPLRCAGKAYEVRVIPPRACSARSRLIPICSALTTLLSAPLGLPSRCALTQLNSVCSTTLSDLAAAAMLCPPSTSLTASRLNSSV